MTTDYFWIVFWTLIASGLAAIISAASLYITLWDHWRKSDLSARIGKMSALVQPGVGRSLYAIEFHITNVGNRGRRHYRATFYFPTDRSAIHNVVSPHGPANKGGPHSIYGREWRAVEFTLGPIFTDDDPWIGNVDAFVDRGPCQILWVIKSDDGRVPADKDNYRSIDVDFK